MRKILKTFKWILVFVAVIYAMALGSASAALTSVLVRTEPTTRNSLIILGILSFVVVDSINDALAGYDWLKGRKKR